MAPPVVVVINASVNLITPNSAQCGGNSIYTSLYTLLEKGLCWSHTNPLPAVSDNYFNEYPSDPTANDYLCSMTGLNPNTLYYVRAYIKTTGGYTYSTGVDQFTTLASNPPKKQVVVSSGGQQKQMVSGSQRLVVSQ